jgi:O-antigen/teichoic acid export membrane protein
MDKFGSARSIQWVTASSFFKALTQLLQLYVLTKILSFDCYGLIAIAMTLISYANLLNDLGLNVSYIMNSNNYLEKISDTSNLYWTNIIASLITMTIVCFLAPVASIVYNENELLKIIILLSLNLPIQSFSLIHKAEAEKSLKFKELAIIDIISCSLGFLSAVILALLECGVYSLIFSSLIVSLINTTLTFIQFKNSVSIAFEINIKKVMQHLRYGWQFVLNNLLNHFNSTFDLLIGSFLIDKLALGYYSIIRNLVLQIQYAVNPIFLRTSLPKIAQAESNPKVLKPIYLKILRSTSTINAPIYILLFAASENIIQKLLNSNVYEAILTLKILSVWGLIRSFVNPVGSLLYGTNNLRLFTNWNISTIALVPLVILGGNNFGLQGLAFSMLLIIILIYFLSFHFLIRKCFACSLFEFVITPLVPILISAATVTCVYFSIEYFQLSAIRLFALPAISLLIYALIYKFLKNHSLDSI